MAWATAEKRSQGDRQVPRNERIVRLQRRYQTEPVVISVQRARLYTQYWRQSENRGEPLAWRIAAAMKYVYENVDLHVDRDDRLAGHWTENFLGVPLMLERGEYNRVLAAELTAPTLLVHRASSLAKGLHYMVHKGEAVDFLRRRRTAGASPLNFELKTMAARAINPYTIDPADRRELLHELLPYWEGRCLADVLEKKLIESGLYSADMHDFVAAIPGNTSRQVMMLSTCATVATIQGHVILDYESVLRQGLAAMRRAAAERGEANDLTAAQRQTLAAFDLALQGVQIFAHRLADAVGAAMNKEDDPRRRAELRRMLAICRRVPEHPAATFAEAVQSLWTIKTAVELAMPINLSNFGRLDQQLIDYYRRDLAAGRLTREDAGELLEELLLKIMSQNIRPESNILGNFYHRYLGSSPVTIGGLRPDGRDGANELTALIMRAAHRSKAVTNIAVRVNEKTPPALLHTLAGYLHEGTSSYAVFNDEIMIEAMRRRGFAERDARDYAIMGCVEATCPGRTGSMSANALQLARLLDITLRNGDSATLAGLIRDEGLRTGDPDTFADFAQLLDAFIKQADHFVRKIVAGSNLRDMLYEHRLPAPHLSAFTAGCLESARDVTAGGAHYDLAGVSMINSLANVVDSLLVIKQLVYERRVLTVRELLAAIDDNFVGHERVRRMIEQVPGKWGNGDAECDALARDIAQRLFALTYAHHSPKGAPFVVYIISMITHTIDGRLSIAGPDGRRAATPYAASCNPYNVERAGVTAVLRSVASLPFADVLGSAVNIKFHPSAIGADAAAREKWVALVRTYFQLGGAQLQPTVVDGRTLRNAQIEPDKYRDLIVKVGGYSTYFVDLGREIQQEVIDRTEHR